MTMRIGIKGKCAAALTAAAFAVGCGGSDRSPDQITADGVRDAIEGTGYEFAYRKTPDIEGYDTIAGRATSQGGASTDFAVVIDVDGPYSGHDESARGGSPQPPIVRGVESNAASSVIGNAFWVVQPQTPGSRELTARVRRAIQDEFGPPYRDYL